MAEHSEIPEFRDEYAEALMLAGKRRGAMGDPNQAKKLYEEALRLREQLTTEHPGNLEYQSHLLDACVLIAASYSNAREADQVAVLYSKVRRISERLAREHPDVAAFAENHCLVEILYLMQLALTGEHRRRDRRG